jgi:hypothetical protein
MKIFLVVRVEYCDWHDETHKLDSIAVFFTERQKAEEYSEGSTDLLIKELEEGVVYSAWEC